MTTSSPAPGRGCRRVSTSSATRASTSCSRVCARPRRWSVSRAMRAARHRLEHVEMLDDAGAGGPGRRSVSTRACSRCSTPGGAAPTACTPQRLGAEPGHGHEPVRRPRLRRRPPGARLGLPGDAVRPVGGRARLRLPPPTGQRISARAAFLAHTRGACRAAGRDDAGVLAPGSPATLAVWSPSDLLVQAPDDRVQAWSTDPRSGTPGLPDLSPGVAPPRLPADRRPRPPRARRARRPMNRVRQPAARPDITVGTPGGTRARTSWPESSAMAAMTSSVICRRAAPAGSRW